MRIIILATLTTATFLLPAMFGGAAQAMTAAPSVTTGLVEKAAVVCGYYGCRRVWPRYYGYRPYRYYGWRRRYW